MSEYTTLLEETLEAWEGVRQGVIGEVRNLPDDRLDWSPAEGARTPAELVHHILLNAELAAGELAKADGDFTRKSYPELVEEHGGGVTEAATKADLVRHLEERFAACAKRIREAGELAMLAPIRRFDGESGTRLAWLNHAIGHEYYHGGQIAIYARLAGVTPNLTRQIRGE